MSLRPIFEGQLIEGRYRLKSFVREGNFGAVFKGHLEIFGQPVREIAVKIAKQTNLDEEKARNVFAEAIMLTRIYDQIEDPVARQYIVPVYDLGLLEAYEQRGFIVMGLIYGLGSDAVKYVPPTSLDHEIHRWKGGMPPDVGLKFFREICIGMAAVHSLKVIHRDLKPDNILLTDKGQIRIVDFGLAAGLNDMGYALGQVGAYRYMAPETALRGKSTPRSDVYSLGVILYELLTGSHPFEKIVPPKDIQTEESRNQWVLTQKQKVTINHPSSINHDLKGGKWAWLDVLALLCMENDPELRLPNAGDLLNVLDQREKHPRIKERMQVALGDKKTPVERGGFWQRLRGKVESLVGITDWAKAAAGYQEAVANAREPLDNDWFEAMMKLAVCYVHMPDRTANDVLQVLGKLEPRLERGDFLRSYADRKEFYETIAGAMEKEKKTRFLSLKYRGKAEEERRKGNL